MSCVCSSPAHRCSEPRRERGLLARTTDAIMTNETLFDFPCEFPLKVMGRHSDDFRSIVLGIVQKHTGPIAPEHIEERPSKDRTYLSLTCTFTAQSREQLDALYRELTSCEKVMVVL